QTALKEFFDQEKQFMQGGGGTTGGAAISDQARRDQDVSVVAHEESNKLLISVSPRKRSQVEALVHQLDAPPPQVMIQCLLAEVTLDNTLEFGMEFNLQQLRFSERAHLGNNGVILGPKFDVVGGTD